MAMIIGNRNTATEGEDVTAYAANELNQYTAVGDFAPGFDADGNQTLVKTATGIWSVEYNAENRPVRFTSADGATVIECNYDSHGRRATKKVTTNGSVTLHQRYIYRGYQQIACCDLSRSGHPCLWLLTWDPTQPIATRPLAIRKDGTWYAYGWDMTKNICEVFGPAGYIRTTYNYTPYGKASVSGDVDQPIQSSSEFEDNEIGLIYYNYRYYNPYNGKWISRDPLGVEAGVNDYIYVENLPIEYIDFLGLIIDTVWDVGNMIWDAGKIVTGAVTGNTALMTEGAIDLALDTAAAVVPGVPAGASKAARAAKAAQKATKRRKNTKAVKKKKHKGQKEVNPGDCTKARHRKLQNRVDFHKKQPGCKGDMSCSELKRNYQYKRKLVSA